MDDTTTTAGSEPQASGATINGVPVDDQGVALTEAQLETAQTDAAGVQTDDISTEPDTTSASVEPVSELSETDQEVIDWAKKKGLDPTDPIKALKVARETERSFHESRSKQSELTKLLQQPEPVYEPASDVYSPQPTGVDPKVALLELRVNHPDVTPGSDLDNEMAAIVGENPTFWVNNLDNAYRIARANLGERVQADAIEQARQQERETLSKTSRLAQPTSQPTVAGDPNGLSWEKIDAMPTAEYARRRDEIQTWMTRGR